MQLMGVIPQLFFGPRGLIPAASGEARLCRTPSFFYPVFFDFVVSASRLARALRISGFPSAQALSIVILLKRHLSRSRIRLQS
jgi:hypothetical protein